MLFTALIVSLGYLWFCTGVAINDKDGHELEVEKFGPTFSIFNPMTAEMSPKNIMVCAP